MTTDFPDGFKHRSTTTVVAVLALLVGIGVAPIVTASPEFACEPGATLATGRPDPGLLTNEASKGVRAFWCERYDHDGNAIRSGPYWETYPNGGIRTRTQYIDTALAGPVSIHNEDGTLFLRGFLEAGDWSGTLEMFHENGEVWFAANFDAGRLEGGLRTHYPDGALESETRFQAGREDGLARSFYPTAFGGRLKSEAHIEADQFVGSHRVLDQKGELIRAIDWNTGPIRWHNVDTPPATPDRGAHQPTAALQQHDLRD